MVRMGVKVGSGVLGGGTVSAPAGVPLDHPGLVGCFRNILLARLAPRGHERTFPRPSTRAVGRQSHADVALGAGNAGQVRAFSG